MKQRKKNNLWIVPALIFVLVSMGAFFARPLSIYANDVEPLFTGLYLVKGENIKLNSVNVTVVVNDRHTSVVTASYEVTNTGENSTPVYMAMPVTSKNMTNVSYRFSPYRYNSVLVSGDKINPMIQGLAVQYDMWRAFSFEVPLGGGETKTASVSYTIENGSTEDGRLPLGVDLDHIKSWKSEPDQVRVSASFNPKTVKAYNFDNVFKPEPTEMTDQFLIHWDFSKGASRDNIAFYYYMVDEVLKDSLANTGNPALQAFVAARDNRDHNGVVEQGRAIVQGTQDAHIQNMVYLFMADSYLALGNYQQTLAVYELLGASEMELGSLENAVRTKILLNQLTCNLQTKNYETLYDTILYERANPDLNVFLKNALEEAYMRIPEETLVQLEEDRKPPSGFELFVLRFLEGDFTKGVLSVFVLLLIVSGVTFYIRRKRKKNNFFY